MSPTFQMTQFGQNKYWCPSCVVPLSLFYGLFSLLREILFKIVCKFFEAEVGCPVDNRPTLGIISINAHWAPKLFTKFSQLTWSVVLYMKGEGPTDVDDLIWVQIQYICNAYDAVGCHSLIENKTVSLPFTSTLHM